ncbi:MAG: ABC transporter ATP-binding protein [Oscillospiraceae bacterium]|jgi:ABC-2 type transport system ATP-binding protein|nr:ABC transporter ATP-binding protein [Oscillospiraceae bacterium]
MNAIEISNIAKKYKGFSLGPISLTLPAGCILGLIGENGAGKTTTIKALLGMNRPDSGEIRLLGQPLSADLRNETGVVLDEVGLPENLRIPQIEKIMKYSFRNWKSDVFAEYVKKFELPQNKRFRTFSKGMKMKLGLAIALSHDAKLLILDEPTAGLDPLVREELLDILNEFTRDEGHAVLISSHIVSDLEKVCDYIAFLHKGQLMLCEEKDRLLEQYGFLQTTAENLDALEPAAIRGKRVTQYGAEALVDRKLVPQTFDIRPVTIEELFVYMAKEG